MTKGKKTHMQKIRECILRLRLRHSQRKISKEIHIHRTILRNIWDIANQKGWLEPADPMPDDHQLHLAFKEEPNRKVSLFDSHQVQIQEWLTAGYTAVVIHRFLKEKISCSISQVRRYLKASFPKQVEPVMVRQTHPGEVLEVDFGFLGIFWDPPTEKFRKTWIFSARLRHSRKTYREVVFNQSQVTFIKCHIHAFEWFGGIPKRVVLDNLKAGVIKSCIDNDQLNRSYREMAEHYKILIDPCLPYSPEHKGGVENDINYIKRSFLPSIIERKKHQPHLDLPTLQQELEKWNREVADVRLVHGVGRSPAVIFEEDEKAALQPLPDSRWDIAEWHECEVRRDWRVMYDSAYYSVPYHLVGKTVQIMATSSIVRIFFEHSPVASHSRTTEKWQYQRNPEHAPPFKEMVLSCTREGLLIQAEEIGPLTHALVQKILSDPAVDKLRPIRKLLTLALSYEKKRMEAACARALHYNTLRYQSVKDILMSGLDQEPIKKAESKIYPMFKNMRDPQEYQIKPTTQEDNRGRKNTHQ